MVVVVESLPSTHSQSEFCLLLRELSVCGKPEERGALCYGSVRTIICGMRGDIAKKK